MAKSGILGRVRTDLLPIAGLERPSIADRDAEAVWTFETRYRAFGHGAAALYRTGGYGEDDRSDLGAVWIATGVDRDGDAQSGMDGAGSWHRHTERPTRRHADERMHD